MESEATEFISISAAAEILGYTDTGVKYMAQRGAVECRVIDRPGLKRKRYLVSKRDVLAKKAELEAQRAERKARKAKPRKRGRPRGAVSMTKKNARRDAAIYRRYLEGESKSDIARSYGLSRQRVEQVINAAAFAKAVVAHEIQL